MSTASIFITGIGTDVGKTIAAAIVAEAIGGDYWKPVQAGYADGTDTEWVSKHLTNGKSRVHPESYKLALPASPHIAAKEEGISISSEKIMDDFSTICDDKGSRTNPIVIEGAGGLMVPLNDNELVIDLAAKLNSLIIIVSRNYLGSINHSLLTAQALIHRHLRVAGWIFNDHFMNYEADIVKKSGYPSLGSIPFCKEPGMEFIREQSQLLRPKLSPLL